MNRLNVWVNSPEVPLKCSILVDYMLLIVSFTKERTFYCNFTKNKLPIGFCQGY